MAYPWLILANAALGEGIEPPSFFTFWGFDMITKKTMGDWQFTPGSVPLPPTFRRGSAGSGDDRDGHPSKPKKTTPRSAFPRSLEFLDQTVASGGGISEPAGMSADMNNLTKETTSTTTSRASSAPADSIEKTDGAQLFFSEPSSQALS